MYMHPHFYTTSSLPHCPRMDAYASSQSITWYVEVTEKSPGKGGSLPHRRLFGSTLALRPELSESMTLTRLTSNREVLRDRDAAQGSDVAWGSDMAQGSDAAQGRDAAQGSGDVVWCLEIQVSKGKTTKKKPYTWKWTVQQMLGQHGGSARWLGEWHLEERFSKRKKNNVNRKKKLTWCAGRWRRSGAQVNNEKLTWNLNARKS